MLKKIQSYAVAIAALILACTIATSCDKDNVDDLTNSLWDTTWTSNDGEVYAFYKTFKGVIYSDVDDYKAQKINKSFIWTTSDSKLVFGVDGYRMADNEWKQLTSDEIQVINYDVDFGTNGQLTLSSSSNSITLTPYKK